MDELSKRRLEKVLAKPSEKLTDMIKTQDNINRLLDELYEHITGQSWARPSFIDSAYFYYDQEGNMCLREGAPAGVVEEFNAYVEAHNRTDLR